MKRWRLADVMEGDVVLNRLFLRDGEVYRLVTVATEPTVCVENLQTGKRSHFIIESPLFAEFEILEPRGPA